MKKIYLVALFAILSFGAKAQLVINEFSQGNSGTKEFVELVVIGTRTCTDSTADIRGWIIDDNNGWYGAAGTGIAAGHMRLANITNWQNVPYGSIILLYNNSDKNVNISLADDPTDANHDYVYVVPVSTSSTYVEYNSSSPSSPSSSTWTYAGQTYSTGANWGVVGLANTGGDAVIIVKPSKPDSAYHSVGYGGASGGTGFHTPYVVKSLVGSQSNCYLTNSSYNTAALWTIGTAGAAGSGDETPGAPNTTANSTWITNMRIQQTAATSSFAVSICQGQSYTYNGIPRTTTGSYLDTFTTSGGCDSIVTLNLTVNTAPAAPSVTTPVSYCQNATATALTATGTGLLWYTGPSSTPGSATAFTPVTTAVGSTTYYVSQTVGGCESPRASIVVNVTAQPSAPAVTTPVTYCQNATVSALTATGTALLWYTGSSGGTGSATAPTPSTTAAGSTTYYVSQTVNGCESPRASIVVNITAAPSAPVVTTPVTYCQNATVIALTATGTGLLWYTGSSGGTGNTTAPTPSSASAGTTTYYVSQTVSGCESPRAAIVVNVTAQPSAPAVTTPVAYCQNAAASALTATGSGLLWYTGPSGGTGNTTAPTPVTTAVGSTTYYVSQTVNGCESPRAAIVVNVTATPAAPVVTSPVTYCQNTTASALTATGSNILWYANASGGTGSVTAPTPSTTAAGSTTYYVSQTVNGCESPRASILVNVTAAPAAPSVTTPVTYCQNTTASMLTATGSNILWYANATGGTGSTTAPTPSTASAGTTTYYVSQTVSGCESPRAAIVVNVTATPAAPAVTTPITYCQNSTASALTATGSNLLWYANATGGTGSATATLPSTATAGSTTYYVSQTVNGCESPRASILVNVTATPSAPVVTSPVAYCQNTTASALTAAGTGLLWYTGPSGGTGATTAPSPSTASAGATTYYVSQTVSGCESPRASIVVNVTAKPQPPATVNITYCQNQAAIPLTATGSNLLWYNTATGGTGNTVAPTPSTSVNGTYNYYVSQTVNGCESDRALLVVTVASSPSTPTVTSPVNLCQNSGTYPLNTYVIGQNLLWYTTASGGTGTTTTPVANTTATGTTTWYVSATAGNCESGRATLVININAKPAPPAATSPVTYCQYATPAPLSATGTGLLWYTTATGGTGSTTAITPNTVNTGSITYYVSQTVNGCESDRTPVTVTVTTQPGAPAVTSQYNYCQFDTPTPLNVGGTGIKWYTTPTGGTGTTTTPTVSTAVAGVTTYYVSQNVNGCESARAAISITVNAKPAPPVTNTVHYCKGDNAVPLTATGTNLKWYTVPAGGIGSTIAPTPATYVVGTTTYYVTQSAGACESDRAAINVVVDDKVTAAIAVSKTTVCQYDTLTLLFAGGAPSTAAFNWGLNGGTLVSGTGAGPLVVRWNTPGQKTITMTVSNGFCIATTTYLITVKPAPSADFKLPKDVCVNELVHIQASDSAQGYSDYLWNFAGATVYGGAGAGAYLLSWNTPGNKIVTLNTVNGICKSAMHADTLTVHDYPTAKITSVSKTDICSGDSVDLRAAVYQDYKYEWSPAAFFTETAAPEVSAVVTVPGYVYLAVTDKYGCKASDSVLINAQPCCQVYLPNAFSPNGDGKNDVFRIITIGHHQIGSFRVVNRWGQTVFETADERHGWDGTLNGTPQEIGTYFYYLKYKCNDGQELEQKGEIILVR